ncbi:MAG: transporter permease [Frankiales bacterium]|jgi:branched-chain amino acid transport system permease protein|nr:transporter permease [Frankiales bacterium]
MSIAEVLNGVALGSLLMVLSSGLAMIYGLRGVTNFAHGALYMVGAYVAYSVGTRLSFWVALLVVPVVLAAVGVVLELVFFRRLEHRSHIEVGLVTFGLALVGERIVVLIWGERTLSADPPSALSGSISVLGTNYPTYRLFVIVAALAMASALVLYLSRSERGLHIRAASHDLETASIMGINVDRVSLFVVALGAALAGLAGTLAVPYVSLDPGMGAGILITVLIVVVIGGVGSIGGAMVAGMGLGIAQTVGTTISPSIAVVIPYLALVLVLLLRPTGLAGRRAA